ncbi:MAG: hypothetical protein FWG99_10815 [Treponema sp.]|nr:hypothetical protein [Treponema sp.]
MANFKLWLVMILAFGFIVNGCDNGSGNNTHNHSFGTLWKTDKDEHWHECTCGDKNDIGSHTLIDLLTTAATESSDGFKILECAVCKYLESQTIPATNASHSHDYSTSWKISVDKHWHECSCGDQSAVADHNFSNDICIICGYIKASGGDVNVPKTLIFYGISSNLMGEHENDSNGFIFIYPAGTPWATVETEIITVKAGSTSITNAVAGNTFRKMERPVQNGMLYTATAPLYTASSLISGGQTLWTGSGSFDIYSAGSDEDYNYIYQMAGISIEFAITNIPAAGALLVHKEAVPAIPAIRGTISLTNIPTDTDVTGVFVIVDASTVQVFIYPDTDIWHNGTNIANGVDFRKVPPDNLSWKIPLQELVWYTGKEREDFFPAWLRFTLYVEYNNNHMDSRSYSVWYPSANTPRHITSLENAQAIDLGTVDLTKQSP